MQSLGFAYAMLPALKRLYPDPQEYRARLQLHMEYFNTQPYLASFILGAAVRMEEERATGRAPAAGSMPAAEEYLDGAAGSAGGQFLLGCAQAAGSA